MKRRPEPVGLVSPLGPLVGYNSKENFEEWLFRHKSRQFTPEQNLLEGLLLDAIDTATNPVRHGKHMGQLYRQRKRIQNEARRWIHSKDRGHVFFFVDVCEWLRLDPDYVRRGVEARYKKAA